MMRPRRSQIIGAVLALALVAGAAQLAGVGGSTNDTANDRHAGGANRGRTLAVLPSSPMVDVNSTKLDSTSANMNDGDTLRIHATANVTATKFDNAGTVQVVCGVRYAREKDPRWTLGPAYQTVTLTRSEPSATVTIDRTIAVPATDTYTGSTACHVAAPNTGGSASATGSLAFASGLPDGAVTPAAAAS